jgi:2-haloalkanoic acid dehalogenase type II
MSTLGNSALSAGTPQSGLRFRAIGFDLLTALIDSWALWMAVAGDEELGRAWRRASLRRVTSAGAYQPYETLVAEAALEVGLSTLKANALLVAWTEGALKPWPEAPRVLAEIAARSWPTVVVTNCSQRLAEAAAQVLGHRFDAIVSAERAGHYKIDPRAYRAGIEELGIESAKDVLFVAGSAHDVPGASSVGMPVYWSNRFTDTLPPGASAPLVNARDLSGLVDLTAAGPIQE